MLTQHRAILIFTTLFLAQLAMPQVDASSEPLFHYRVLMSSFRKSSTNSLDRVAAEMKTIVPADIQPWVLVSLELSVAGYNYLNGDTPLEFCTMGLSFDHTDGAVNFIISSAP